MKQAFYNHNRVNCIKLLFADVALGKWCRSIEKSNIKNTNLDDVRTSVVYCTNDVNETGYNYDSDEAGKIGRSIESDADRTTNEEKELFYMFWRQHPLIQQYCCLYTTNYSEYLNALLKIDDSYTHYIRVLSRHLNNLLKFDKNFDYYIDSLSRLVGRKFRSELSVSCSSSSLPFCDVKEVFFLIDRADKLSNASEFAWEEEHKKAFQVNFILLRQKYPSYFSQIKIYSRAKESILLDTLDSILGYVKENRIDKLSEMVKYLPTISEYRPGELCNTDSLCDFLKIIEQVEQFVQLVDNYNNPIKNTRGKITRVLNTQIDYKGFLLRKQLDNILHVVSEEHTSLSIEIASYLKNIISTGFSEIGDFFESVASDNLRIANADISDSRIEAYQDDLNRLLPVVKEKLLSIILNAIKAADLNVNEKTVLLALDLLDASNPLKHIFGGGPVQDVINSAADLSNALVDSKRANRVKESFDDLKMKSEEIIRGLEANDRFLETMTKIVRRSTLSEKEFQTAKEEFLNSYREYNSEVTRPQIVGLRSYWINLVDEACNIILGTDSSLSSALKESASEDCLNVKTKIAEMMAIYEEIYDFQFDLIDALVRKIMAQSTVNAARNLQREFIDSRELNPNADSTLTKLAMIGGLSYVTYRTTTLQAIYSYCDILRYVNPSAASASICKGPETDISTLVNHNVRSCTSEVHEFLHDVPTKQDDEGSDEYMNINKLYSGKFFHFKIPNSQWLVDRKWIPEHQKDYALYVEQFEVFLPTNVSRDVRVYVHALPEENVKYPDSDTEYKIEPEESLLYEYTEGPTAKENCRRESGIHPYMTCMDEGYHTICHRTTGITRNIYPSIYARWKITLNGYEDYLRVPHVVSEGFTLKIGMKLCKLSNNPFVFIASERGRMQSRRLKCCGQGEYRSSTNGGECKACPGGSYSKVAGYYCDRNAVSEKEKEKQLYF